MRSVLLAVAMLFAGCESGGGHGHGGGGGFGGFGHGGGGGEHSSHSSSSSSSSSSSKPSLESHHSSSGSPVWPIAKTVAEALLVGAIDPDAPDPDVNNPAAPARETTGPLLDNHDPCNRCPDDFECGQCTGVTGAACTWAPAGAASRCATPR
ncbi:MAG TPA: hypothetical protein VH143_01100 [Kofleriaceae bacterium]|nr:hypothetical protein [Kofleriaceae bacterium]